jgi:deoxyribodipyrimidine photo-lyase
VNTSVMVFTRDLRVHDNPALAAAAADAAYVIPVFVFDEAILRRHGVNQTRLAFMLGSLRDLDASLSQRGGRLVIRRGPWAKTVTELAAEAGAAVIHLAEDVSGYAQRRLALLQALARNARVDVRVHPGVTVAGPEPLRPASGGPYQVFTPYYRKWGASPRRGLALAPGKIRLPEGVQPGRIPELAELNSGPTPGPAGLPAVAGDGGESAGLRRLKAWSARNLVSYDRGRDDLAADATSRLSPYLHFGCLSPLAVATELTGRPGGEPFVRQLAWRDFFAQLLAARPDAARRDFRDYGDQWHDDADGLAAWQAGQTGFPVVDAAMRQLAAEGFMHNRARMIVASFLTKDLYVDWRKGAEHFLALLVDADLASNQLNWQWVAGTGTDRQPHRIFNPTVQGKRFDPKGEYVARYVPELTGLPDAQLHDPAPEIRRARRYPAPIVDHQTAAASWRARSR